MRVRIYCDRPSSSARALARLLHGRKVGANAQGTLRPRDKHHPKGSDVIINYGTAHKSNWEHAIHQYDMYLNLPRYVSGALYKWATSDRLTVVNIPCVQVTRDVQLARQWEQEGHSVLSRVDCLSGGKGIRLGIYEDRPLVYSKVYKKTHEFRVHVGLSRTGERMMALIYQKKKKRVEGEVDTLVRSHANGWVFSKNNLILDEEDQERIKVLACDAVKALNLDFGAVDVLVKMTRKDRPPRKIKDAVVCEVNPAPGLEITDIYHAYCDYFMKRIEEYGTT